MARLKSGLPGVRGACDSWEPYDILVGLVRGDEVCRPSAPTRPAALEAAEVLEALQLRAAGHPVDRIALLFDVPPDAVRGALAEVSGLVGRAAAARTIHDAPRHRVRR